LNHGRIRHGIVLVVVSVALVGINPSAALAGPPHAGTYQCYVHYDASRHSARLRLNHAQTGSAEYRKTHGTYDLKEFPDEYSGGSHESGNYAYQKSAKRVLFKAPGSNVVGYHKHDPGDVIDVYRVHPDGHYLFSCFLGGL
jgi:hypothetical protein